MPNTPSIPNSPSVFEQHLPAAIYTEAKKRDMLDQKVHNIVFASNIEPLAATIQFKPDTQGDASELNCVTVRVIVPFPEEEDCDLRNELKFETSFRAQVTFKETISIDNEEMESYGAVDSGAEEVFSQDSLEERTEELCEFINGLIKTHDSLVPTDPEE